MKNDENKERWNDVVGNRNRRGGVVASYMKENTSFKVLSDLCHDDLEARSQSSVISILVLLLGIVRYQRPGSL